MKDRVTHKLSALGIAVVLSGCSTSGPSSDRAWRIEPVLKVAHSESTAQGYHALGRYYDGMRAWHKAIEAYQRALVLGPGNVDSRNALAVSLAQSGRFRDAETELRQALAAAPERADLHSNLGYLLLLAGRSDDALLSLHTALRLDPQDRVARANLKLAHRHAPVSSHAAQVEAGSSPTPLVTTESGAPFPSQPVGAAPKGVDHAMQASPVISNQFPSRARVDVAMERPAPEAPAAVTPFSLEVTNGLGKRGAARQLGRQLQVQGVNVQYLSSLPPYRQPFTVVLYRPGQEVAAQHVASMLPLAPQLVMQAAQRTDVRVLLGRDWARPVRPADTGPATEQGVSRLTLTSALQSQ